MIDKKEQKNKGFKTWVKENISSVLTLVVTLIVSVFIFDKIGKLDDRVYDLATKVSSLETSVLEVSNKLNDIKIQTIDDIDNLSLRVIELEKEVF